MCFTSLQTDLGRVNGLWRWWSQVKEMGLHLKAKKLTQKHSRPMQQCLWYAHRGMCRMPECAECRNLQNGRNTQVAAGCWRTGLFCRIPGGSGEQTTELQATSEMSVKKGNAQNCSVLRNLYYRFHPAKIPWGKVQPSMRTLWVLDKRKAPMHRL